jgi:PAS domain S-box-containing protein
VCLSASSIIRDSLAIDALGNFCYASPSYQAVLGYGPEQLIGRPIRQYVHPNDVQRLEREAQHFIQEGRIDSRMELRVRHTDGHYLWIESSSQFVLDAQRQIASTVLIGRDITGRKQADDTLARYGRGMRALYETSLEINSQPDVATLLNAIVRRATDLLGAGMGGLYLTNQNDQSLVLVSSVPSEHVGAVMQSGEGLAGRVAQSGQPLFIADYSSWPERSDTFASTR